MSWDGYPNRKWAGQPPELWLGILLYLLLGVVSISFLQAGAAPAAWRVALGLLPSVPLLLVMRGYLRMVRQQDELYKRVQFEAIAIAACITVIFSFTVWFMEAFAIIPHVSMQWAGILLFFSYAIASGILMRNYT